MQVDCQDHRKSMELLALRLQLKKGIPDPDEERRVEERLHALEGELGIN